MRLKLIFLLLIVCVTSNSFAGDEIPLPAESEGGFVVGFTGNGMDLKGN